MTVQALGVSIMTSSRPVRYHSNCLLPHTHFIRNVQVWKQRVQYSLEGACVCVLNCFFFLSIAQDWKSVQDVPNLVDNYMEGGLKLDEFITQSLPLDQINQAFDTLRSGEGWVQRFSWSSFDLLRNPKKSKRNYKLFCHFSVLLGDHSVNSCGCQLSAES